MPSVKHTAWMQIKQIFYDAVEQPASQRQEYVDRACKAVPELRPEVQRLIAGDKLTGSPVDDSAPADAELLASRLEWSVAHRQIGAYRLLAEIGAGSMGTVYLAERADGEFRKRVAVKLVSPGMDHESVVERFRHERQILAGLEHSNIAKLLDGGVTAQGLPFFVMEFIEGIPIDQY